MLSPDSRDEYQDFDTFPIVHPQNGTLIPLSAVADITPTRNYARTARVNNLRTVTVYGEIDAEVNNTKAVMADLESNWLPDFRSSFPDISISFEGEVKNGGESQASMGQSFIL